MRVVALFCGAGLPKPRATRLEIGGGGVAGDVNRYRARRRGDLDMAVSLLALETIEAVAAERWPEVVPGALGENITTGGLDPAALASGQRYRVGSAVVELSRPMEPCANLAALVGREWLLRFQRDLRGRRGWYARVVAPGVVAPGDSIPAVP